MTRALKAAAVTLLPASPLSGQGSGCANYICWRFSSLTVWGWVCGAFPGLGNSSCVATIGGCVISSCSRTLIRGPGGQVLALLELPCRRREAIFRPLTQGA